MTEVRKPVEDLLTDYDIFDPDFVKDPYPSFSEIRESQWPTHLARIFSAVGCQV
jgi:hypothetical protein